VAILPSHHIRRPRLTSPCVAKNVVLLEAAGGYGKSVLAAELADTWGAVAVEVLLEEGPVSGQLFASRLKAAVERAGFSDAAESIAPFDEDVVGGVDSILSALRDEVCAFVIDDAHHCDRNAGLLIDRMAAQLSQPQRLIVACRRLPPGVAKARRAPSVHLDAHDLALRPDETLELCRTGFGLQVTAETAGQLDEATAGWTAAAVLAAARASSTGEDLRGLTEIDGGTDAQGVFDSLLHEAVDTIGVALPVLAAIGHLPYVDRRILDDTAGRSFFERALGAGLPFSASQDGRWTLPGPVRDFLVGLCDADPETLNRAAARYAANGDLGAGLRLLVSAQEPELAAELLERAAPADADAIDVLELLAIVDRLPRDVVDRHPRALLHVSMACEFAPLVLRREQLMEQLILAEPKSDDPSLKYAIDSELAADRMRDVSAYSEAERMARHVLEGAPVSAALPRARALSVVGKARCWHREADGRFDESELRRAATELAQAYDTYVTLGLRQLAAGVAAPRAMWIEFNLGRHERSLEILSQAIDLLSDHPTRKAWLLPFRAEVLGELARHEECEAEVDELFRIASLIGDPPMMLAYGHWSLMTSYSYRGNAQAALEHARQVEANRDEWWDYAGQDFLATAAEDLDRVGYTSLASEILERARAQPGDAEGPVALAECALMARHGDPALAEERLSDVFRFGIQIREYWRVTLLRAYAAMRRGDPATGALAARAFEQAAALGQPNLPLYRERELTEALLGLAKETGLPAALDLEAASLPIALNILGGFELTSGGRPVVMRGGQGGQAAQLLKFVAASGGRLPTDVAIETLWPEADPEAGRNRLRTVLNRLRDAAGDVIAREGELLVLAPEVRLDLSLFESEARQALALGSTELTPAVAMARSAISRYRGDLLPHDLYSDWSELPRQHARHMMLDLLDLCAGAAAERGDLDELRRVVVRTIELAPQDDARYLRAASLLMQQGRKAAALAVVRRARAALSELGLELPLQLVRLEKDLVA